MAGGRVLQTFLELVGIDSPTGEEAAVAAYCGERLRALGFEVREDASSTSTGSDSGNLIAEMRGGSGKTLVLSAHMDCVEPCRGVVPVIENGRVCSAGETVLGADDKAGIAAIFEASQRILDSGGDRPDLRVILTVSEENGLRGAKGLDAAALESDLCLVLDADGAPGGIVTGAPTHYTFVATFRGRAAHAGVAPEEGRSALVMASRAVAAMRLGRVDERTTANVGTVTGGTATNVIPALATVTGECRSLDAERVEALRLAMDTALREAARAEGGSVDVAWTREYVGFDSSEAPVVELVADACRDAGLEPRLFQTGGGSDGNIFAESGVPTLVLSCGMQGVHGNDESIAVADLESVTDLIVAVAARLAR